VDTVPDGYRCNGATQMQPLTQVHLRNAVEHLLNVTGEIRADTNTILATKEHIEIIRHNDDLRKATASIKEARKALDEIEEHMSREDVPDILRANKIKTITVEGVGRVTISHRWSASMIDKEAGIKWLKANDYGGIVQETVNAQTLAAHAKALMEGPGTELPADLFKVGQMAYTSITKA
jgi:hypothetical protein